MAKLNRVVGALVDDEIDEQQLAARLQHTLYLAHQRRGIGDEVGDEKQYCRIQGAVLDGQLLDRPCAQLDVGTLLESLPSLREHRSRLIDGDDTPD